MFFPLAAALALLLLPAAPVGGGEAPGYPLARVPTGSMTYWVPLNPVLQSEYLDVSVRVEEPLYFGVHEVTGSMWRRCAEDGGCTGPAGARGENLPVVRVTWHQAMAFARWYSMKTGRRFRLPTEHEWFYAASLGRGHRVGEESPDPAAAEKTREVPKRIFPVGAFGRNAWGIQDLGGNVWEWTLGCYSLNPERVGSPQDPEALSRPESCSTRVVGGTYRAHVPDFIADTYNGGCATSRPAANLNKLLAWYHARSLGAARSPAREHEREQGATLSWSTVATERLSPAPILTVPIGWCFSALPTARLSAPGAPRCWTRPWACWQKRTRRSR